MVSSVFRSSVRGQFSVFQSASCVSDYTSYFHPWGFSFLTSLAFLFSFWFVKISRQAFTAYPGWSWTFNPLIHPPWVLDLQALTTCLMLCCLCNECHSFNWYFSLSVLLILFEDLSIFCLSLWVSYQHDPLFAQLSWGINRTTQTSWLWKRASSRLVPRSLGKTEQSEAPWHGC